MQTVTTEYEFDSYGQVVKETTTTLDEQDWRNLASKGRHLALAFTEWDRRYREEPDRFQSDVARLLTSDAETYGEQASAYLMEILADI
jgi:hypothetical protein